LNFLFCNSILINFNTADERIAKMNFAVVYSLHRAKVENKGRTKEGLHQVIGWLTGFDNEKLQDLSVAIVLKKSKIH